MKAIIIKDFRIESNPHYSYYDCNECNVLARYINDHRIEGYCGLKADDIISYKQFKNSVHVYLGE